MRRMRIGLLTAGGLLVAAVVAAASCAQQPGEVFVPVKNPPIWPAPPEPPRIRYVGELATEADLKPAVAFGKAFGQAFFGKDAVRSMLTPYAVCTDGDQRIFVADSNAQVVQVFNLGTRAFEQWQPDKDRKFTQPVGVAWDGERLLVSDSVGGEVDVFDRTGRLTATWGGERFKRPCGIAVDRGRGRIFVADAAAHQVVVLDLSGDVATRVGQRGSDLGSFNYPTNVAVDSRGRLYVSDSLNFRIQQFDPSLKPTLAIGKKGDIPGTFAQPKGIAVDADDHLYVVDAQFEAVQIFDSSGALLLSFGEEGRGPGQFWLPAGIGIDSRDRIWIADSYNRRIQLFDYIPEARP